VQSLPSARIYSVLSKLDEFWSMHVFVYDYRANPLAARSYNVIVIIITKFNTRNYSIAGKKIPWAYF